MSQYTFPPVTISSIGVSYEKANAATALPSTLAIIGGWTGTAITALKTAADGALQIDVESGHGLATEAKQDTIETTLTAIETDADTIAGAVSGTEMQVDIVASLPAGTNEIGKLAAGTASIGTVVLGAGTAAIGKLVAGTASIGTVGLDAGSNNIGDVDILSVIPGVGATNLGKAIQSAQGTTDTGVPALVVRNDTLADLAGADHDYAPLQVNASGALYVEVKTSGLPSGAATEAKQDTIETTLTAIETDADTIAGAVSGTEMQVDVVASLPAGSNNIGDVDVLSVVPGVAATSLGKAIQSAQGTTDTGVAALVVRNDTLADLAGADHDYAPLQVNASGALYTTVASLPSDGKNYVWKEGLNSTISGITNGILDCSTLNIPSGTQLTVATLSNDIYEIQTVEDIGEYMGIYSGTDLKAILPLGGGNVKINLASGATIKLASFSGTAISSGSIAINFLG